MKNGFVIAFVSILMAAALWPGAPALARTYATSFSLTENRISEGGNWVNGAAAGFDWSDVRTANGIAMGTQTGSGGFDDSTALLSCSWGANQTVTATVFATNQQTVLFEEVEIRLRSALTTNSCTGYEVLFSMKNDASAYCQIVRWNGALASFTYVAATGGSQCILHNGDVVKATITNQTITAYINGIQILQGSDSTYSSGSPGMGFFGSTDVNSDYGFTDFTATDGLAPPEIQPPVVTLTSPVAAAVVSNTVPVSANVTDNVGVAGVQFQVDGVNVGAELLSPPYTNLWNTSNVRNGLHTVQAVARDLACNLAAMGVSVAVSNVVVPALVAAYALDEGSEATVGDISGNGNIGRISGAAWTASGKYGNALSFGGTSWLTVNDSSSLDLITGMTLEAWVFPLPVSGTWETVLIKETQGNLVYMIACDSANHPAVYIVALSGLQGIVGPLPLPANTWSHLAGTYDGAMLRLFVNGDVVASQSASGNIDTSSGPLRVGGNSIWGEYFNGTIDEIRVYNRALIKNEIQADMARSIGASINHAPVTASPVVQRYASQGVKVPVTALLGSDPDGDALFLQMLVSTSPNGAMVSTNQGRVVYVPPPGFTNADSFAYSVGDGRGGVSPGIVTVQVKADTAALLNLTIQRLPGGSLHILFDGMPGRTYAVQYTGALGNPSQWQTLGSMTVDGFGAFEFVDMPPSNAPTRYYRTLQLTP